MEQEVRAILSGVACDRERAMQRIQSLWKKQSRPIPKEEIDEWLKMVRNRDDS
jgi:hypothetical protein